MMQPCPVQSLRAPASSARELTWRAAGCLALVAAAWPELGPLGWLPSPLRWPLVGAGVVWLAFARLLEGRRRGAIGEALLLGMVFCLWGLIKLVGIHPSRADDGVYFYLATRVGEGALPYRDFFFAHPPVHLLVPAAVFEVFGFSLPLARAIPVLAQAAAGLMLYLAARPASRRFALFALLLHLWGYQVLMGSSDMNGGNLMSAFLAAALLLVTRGHPLVAGLCSGLALGTGLYALAGALAIGLGAALLGRRALLRYGAGLAAACLAWSVPFALLAPAPFFDGVFSYHLAKTSLPGSGRASLFAASSTLELLAAWAANARASLTGSEPLRSLCLDAPQWVGAALGACALAARGCHRLLDRDRPHEPRSALAPKSPQGLAVVGLAGWGLFVLQWSALSELYGFYLVPMFLFLALPGAWAVHASLEALRAPEPGGRLGAVVLLCLLCLHPLLSSRLAGSLWPEEERQRGERIEYAWSDPWVPRPLAGLARRLFFEEHRTRGERQPAWRHYVWNKALGVSTALQIAEYLRSHSSETETITGGSTLAPLVALLAGRRMAGDEADTNHKRFRLGQLSERAFFERACADRLRFVLAAPRTHFTVAHLEQDGLLRGFALDRVFLEPAARHRHPERYVLYRRLDDGAGCSVAESPSDRSDLR